MPTSDVGAVSAPQPPAQTASTLQNMFSDLSLGSSSFSHHPQQQQAPTPPMAAAAGNKHTDAHSVPPPPPGVQHNNHLHNNVQDGQDILRALLPNINISACNLPPAQPASMHDPFIPGAICNQTLEPLTESTQPVIRECPPQRCSAVIAEQHQSLAAATSAATAEHQARRSAVTRWRQHQQQRHSESPEPALPQAFQHPCSSSTSLFSPPSSTPSSLTSSSSSSSMHPALLAAATAGHHPMLLDVEQVSRQYPAAAAMSSYRGATALPLCTGPHHGQHPACTGATHSSWSSVPLPACSMQHIPARGLFPPGNPAALQLPPTPTPRPRGRPRKRP